MAAPFGINQDHRNSLARAIRGFLQGSKDFRSGVTEKQLNALEYLANRLECDEMTTRLYTAAGYVPCLPYTQPPCDTEPLAFAVFCAACVLTNEGQFTSVRRLPADAALEVIERWVND